MTKRRLFLVGTLAVWLIALSIVVKTALDRLPVPPWGNPMGEALLAEAAGETQVGQQFTAPLPGLYRIEVTLAPPASGDGQARLIFHLKTDPAAAEDLWTAEVNVRDIQEGAPYGFEFEPIRASAGQSYYFYLESPESAPGEAVVVRYSPNAVLEGASACLDGQPVAGDLQFHTFYSLRTREKADLLLSRMAEGRPYMFGSKGFYAGLAVAYALVLGVFLLQIARAIAEERS